AQLGETAALLAAAAGHRTHDLVWQSRSGRPHTPWLEPDVNDHLRALAGSVQAVVMAPIGFVSDHMEVVWDLDVQAAATATELGIAMARAATPGTAPDPRFVAMLAELVLERLEPDRRPRRLGRVEARTPRCGAACCPAPGRGRRAGAGA
ncbi:MAG: ferrochelatase, partial [Acidimicrobiales bacterium]